MPAGIFEKAFDVDEEDKDLFFHLHNRSLLLSLKLICKCDFMKFNLKRLNVCWFMKAEHVFLFLSFGISLKCNSVRLPQGLFVFPRALSQPRLIQSWCRQLPWKDGADIVYLTLLELLTRPSERCCMDCRQRGAQIRRMICRRSQVWEEMWAMLSVAVRSSHFLKYRPWKQDSILSAL